MRHEKRARPRRSTPPPAVTGAHSCPLEEDPPQSELDLPDESEPLSPSEDSLLDSAQHVCAGTEEFVKVIVAATSSFRRVSSSCISRAKSSAVNAHLRALGLTGVFLENKKVQVPVGAPKREVALSLFADVMAVVEQKGALGGMLIGGGILFRFTEREPDPDDVPMVDVARVGVAVPVEDGTLIGEEVAADETVRLSRGPRRPCAGLARVVSFAAWVCTVVASDGTAGACTGTGVVVIGTLLTGV